MIGPLNTILENDGSSPKKSSQVIVQFLSVAGLILAKYGMAAKSAIYLRL